MSKTYDLREIVKRTTVTRHSAHDAGHVYRVGGRPEQFFSKHGAELVAREERERLIAKAIEEIAKERS